MQQIYKRNIYFVHIHMHTMSNKSEIIFLFYKINKININFEVTFVEMLIVIFTTQMTQDNKILTNRYPKKTPFIGPTLMQLRTRGLIESPNKFLNTRSCI